MELTAETQAYIREVAYQAAEAVYARHDELEQARLDLHAAQCPARRKTDRLMWMTIGAALSSGIGGGLVGGWISKMLQQVQ